MKYMSNSICSGTYLVPDISLSLRLPQNIRRNALVTLNPHHAIVELESRDILHHRVGDASKQLPCPGIPVVTVIHSLETSLEYFDSWDKTTPHFRRDGFAGALQVIRKRLYIRILSMSNHLQRVRESYPHDKGWIPAGSPKDCLQRRARWW